MKDCEFLSSFAYLENPFKSHSQEIGYVFFGKIGQLRVALLKCQGNTTPDGCAITTKDAITKLRPKAVFSVGVCGGLNPAKVCLGDVVITSKLATYSHSGIRTLSSKASSYVIRNADDGWKAPLQDPDDREVKIHRDGVLLSVQEPNRKMCEELIQCHSDAIAIEVEGEGEIKYLPRFFTGLVLQQSKGETCLLVNNFLTVYRTHL